MRWYITDGFDVDFGVDQWHGHNVFFRDGQRVIRTYRINGRSDEAMGTTRSYLDITPLGRRRVQTILVLDPGQPRISVPADVPAIARDPR